MTDIRRYIGRGSPQPEKLVDQGDGSFARKVATDNAPAAGLVDVTPDDDNDLPGGACRGLLVTAEGNLEVVCADESTPTAFPVTAGFYLLVSVIRVTEGTTATVKALYGYAV